jgi:hypothetical protein
MSCFETPDSKDVRTYAVFFFFFCLKHLLPLLPAAASCVCRQRTEAQGLALAAARWPAAARQAEKNQQKNDIPSSTYLLFLRFFKTYVYGVFELLMQRNGQKRD